MSAKLVSCKTCGTQISSNAKACPSCGAKNKKPLYKRWWFYVLIALVLIILLVPKSNKVDEPASGGSGASNENNSNTPSSSISETKKEKLEIIEGPEEEADAFTTYYVGIIKNNTEKEFSYAQITINLYDKDGNLLGSAMDNINNLKAGGTWKFKAMALIGDNEEIASFEVEEVTGW